ncbi:MAG: glutamine synthetase [Deltaproteobacteria bacterium]|nr:MAG: glutamine synthetase [Deltaproteobacteria bacterium]
MTTGAENPEKIIERYEMEGIHRIKLGVTDIDGVIRGKYLSLEKFASILTGHGGFCDCIFGWDVEDRLYDNATFTGWHTGFPDAFYRLDLSTERRLPDEGNIPYFVAEMVESDGHSPHPICPRNLLERVLQRAESLGFGVDLAFEYEFFVFRETPHSVREKHYRDLIPLSPGNFGYSVLRTSALSDLFNAFSDTMNALDIPLEGLHCETGPGVWEAAIRVDSALRACDKAALFKTFAKAFFEKREMMATFMAKWSMAYPGQSGHCHESLTDRATGRPLFHAPGRRGSMSEVMEHYVAGLLAFMRPFLVMSAPTINSYTRLVKGAWAPTAATWGIENRTTALRVIPGSEKSQRVEYRVGAADGNPYLVAAATIGAGLLGIERNLPLPEPITGNAYEVEATLPPEAQLPGNLRDATRIFEQSREARELFGDAFVDHYTASRLWEVREYERCVNDWQLARYFEII